MIVRILGEGQFEIDSQTVQQLNSLDEQLLARLDGDEAAAFEAVLHEMLRLVRTMGRAMSDDTLDASDAILPPTDASLADVRALLGVEGLVPD